MARPATDGSIGVAVRLLCAAYQAIRVCCNTALRRQATRIDAHHGVAVHLRYQVLTLGVVRLLLSEKICVGAPHTKHVRPSRFLITHQAVTEGTSHKVIRLRRVKAGITLLFLLR